MLTDPLFRDAVWRGLKFVVMTVPLGMVLAFLFACLVVSVGRRFATLLKVSIYIPTIISAVITSITFSLIYDYSGGLLNWLLGKFGIEPISWLGDPAWALKAIAAPAVWLGMGLTSLIMVAAMVDIPTELYEAASMEGANWWQKTFYITIPQMKNIILYLLVTGIVAAIQQYELPLVMTNGGPLDSTTLPNLLIFNHFRGDQTVGYSVAAAILLFLVLGSISALIFRVLNSDLPSAQFRKVGGLMSGATVAVVDASERTAGGPATRKVNRTWVWWLGTAMKGLVGVIFIVAALFPLAWMVLAGFKSKTEVVATPFQFFPEVWKWQNYAKILQDPLFLRTMLWTFGGALLFTLLSLTVNSLAAYAFARLEFRGKRVLWPLLLMTMFIPGMTILLTSFIVVTKLQMLDTLAVLVLPGAASAATIFFIRQFYLNIPSSLEEAAMLDGCGRFGIFWHLFLPLSRPPFVVMGITAFLAYWNSYVWPILTITSPDKFVLQQYLATFRSERSSELGMLLAGSTLAAAPVLILFLIFQRQIIGNIKMAGLK